MLYRDVGLFGQLYRRTGNGKIPPLAHTRLYCDKQLAGKQDFKVDPLPRESMKKHIEFIARKLKTPDEEQIAQILQQMGKQSPSDELNCGSCGYDTCREKAIAIYQGKADLSMCLPFLKDKAESFSDNIINNSPNGIFVLNEKLEVQQINKSALKIMNIRSAKDVLGEPVIRILDPQIFMQAKQTKLSIHNNRVYLAEYNRYVDQSVLYDKDYRILICIMRDVTSEETEREKKESIRRQTFETADRVVEKQMRIVQEIASLLGETTAETKIALTKLKESISDE